jgi:hypothetical protein
MENANRLTGSEYPKRRETYIAAQAILMRITKPQSYMKSKIKSHFTTAKSSKSLLMMQYNNKGILILTKVVLNQN